MPLEIQRGQGQRQQELRGILIGLHDRPRPLANANPTRPVFAMSTTYCYLSIAALTLIFSLATAASTTLLGDRGLLAGNMLSVDWAWRLLLHWKLWLSIGLAILARISFVGINHFALKIPALASAATTVTAFITCIAFIFLVGANVLFLNEKVSLTQLCGIGLIMTGVFVMVR